jgi:hypothetical protein
MSNTIYKYPIAKGQGRALPLIGAKPRLFQVVRNKDGKNISGVGHIIDGVVLASGKVIIEWQGERRSIAIFENLNHFLSIHVKPKYEGENEFKWIDGYKPAQDVKEALDTVQDYVIRFDEMKQKHKGALIGLIKGIKRKYEEII